MYKVEPFLPEDIFSLDLVNLDVTTDNYTFLYYLQYHLDHSEQMLAIKTENIQSDYFIHSNKIVGYVIGKIEEQKYKGMLSVLKNKKGDSMHISVISIAPSHRKNGLATYLCTILEKKIPDVLFVDLFVRISNHKAIAFYEKMGYVKFRKIFFYYNSPEEDAWDMRKFIKSTPSKGKDVSVKDLFISN